MYLGHPRTLKPVQVLIKLNLRGPTGHRYVVAEERPIRAMRLLLDRHREFLQSRRFKPALAQDSCQLPCQRSLVRVTCEERDRLAALTSSPCVYSKIDSKNLLVLVLQWEEFDTETHLSVQFGGCNLR